MALSFFYFNMGRMQDAFDAAERATEAYAAAAQRTELAWALTQQGYCLYLLGRAGESRDAVLRAVATAREQDDPLRLAGALNAFALTIPIERVAERFAPLEEAIRCYRAAGDEGAIVPTANLAETHYATGNYASALAAGLDVVAMTRKNRDRSNLAAALTNVAAYALTLDDVEQADAAAREALGLVRDIGKTLNTMCALQHLGSVAARRGDYVRGRTARRRVEPLVRGLRAGARVHRAVALRPHDRRDWRGARRSCAAAAPRRGRRAAARRRACRGAAAGSERRR